MATRLQKVLVWMVLGVFGAPSLLGTSLHCVPGCGHGITCCGAQHNHACGDTCPAGHDEQAGFTADAELGDVDQCPICHFLYSGKVLATDRPLQLCTAAAPVAPVLDRFFAPHFETQPFGPRGPPLG